MGLIAKLDRPRTNRGALLILPTTKHGYSGCQRPISLRSDRLLPP